MPRKITIGLFCLSFMLCLPLDAAERPTCNRDTCDPKPDILPNWLMDCSPGEYRRAYNRPRYVAGWLAHTFEPSSQEAMVWCEAKRAGLYEKHHLPPMYKCYHYPKPWEILDTGPRPDFARPGLSTKLQAPHETANASESESSLENQSIGLQSIGEPGKVSVAKEFRP